MENAPELWRHLIPRPAPEGNKYDRGHAVVAGGDMASTGAARLAAISALRIGAGLATVACPPSALPVYAATLLAVMVRPCITQDGENFRDFLEDPRINAVLVGPGGGVGARMQALVLAALVCQKSCVLDADALTSFEGEPEALFAAIRSSVVLTPHEGEFSRLFGRIEGEKEVRAREASRRSGAVVLLKGAQTVIAGPDGKLAVNRHGTPYLATAGSGDVLAGMIAGLLAQGVPAFDAACMAAWMHGEAGKILGPGLIAEDLPGMLPKILARGFEDPGKKAG